MEEKKQIRMVLVMIVLITILPLGNVNAVIQDLFEYEPGAELVGLGDAAGGWDDPWVGDFDGSTAEIVEGSMTVSPIRKGNRLECKQLEAWGWGFISRYFAEPVPDVVCWVSFSMQKHNDENFESWCGLALTDEILWVGKPYNSSCYGIDSFSDWGVIESDIPVTTEAWLVMKMELAGQGKDDMAYLWVNPDPAMDPNVTTPDVTTGFKNKPAGFTELIVDWGNNGDILGAADFTIDEIRWGSSWADVRGFTDGQARNPSPADEDTLIVCDVVLSWDEPLGVSSPVYNVYMDPNILVLESRTGTAYSSLGQTETTFDPPGDLELDTTYYWVVDVTNGDQGSVWNFTTCPEIPFILTQPQNQTVPAGSDAVLSIEILNVNEYAWYKAGQPTVLSTTDTLTIENAQLADEGYYYCELTNDFGMVVSDQARLMTQRLVGWWKLDGDLTDSVQDEVPGAPAHDGTGEPNFIGDGINGSGLEFLADGRIVIVPDTGDYFNFHPQGMTVSIWIRPRDAGDWDGIISKQLRPEDYLEAVGWCIDINGRSDWGQTGAHFTLRGSHGDLFGNDDDGDMFDDQWHLVTAVMNPDTQTSKIYINGSLKNESVVYDFGDIEMNDEPLVFGAEGQTNMSAYEGHIDDVKIFNYPLSSIDVALLYTDFVEGVDVCAEYPAYDLNEDCVINLDDFAMVAGDWMSCNIVPTCIDP
jgi:hypothetical protein